MSLKADKSQGPDILHTRVLKDVAVQLLNVLVTLFQSFIVSGLLL